MFIGETNYKTTTNPKEIQEWHHNSTKNQLIFTTYHSLHRIMEDVEADTVYYDEHTIQFKGTSLRVSRVGLTSLVESFTSLPHLNIIHHRSGMNNEKVYDKVIAEVPAPELIEKGYIVPPQVKSVKYPVGFYESVEEIDRCMILDALKNEEAHGQSVGHC